MLTKEEMAERLGIHVATLVELGAARDRHPARVQRARVPLTEPPGPKPPIKQCSRWNRLVDRGGSGQGSVRRNVLTSNGRRCSVKAVG